MTGTNLEELVSHPGSNNLNSHVVMLKRMEKEVNYVYLHFVCRYIFLNSTLYMRHASIVQCVGKFHMF